MVLVSEAELSDGKVQAVVRIGSGAVPRDHTLSATIAHVRRARNEDQPLWPKCLRLHTTVSIENTYPTIIRTFDVPAGTGS